MYDVCCLNRDYAFLHCFYVKTSFWTLTFLLHHISSVLVCSRVKCSKHLTTLKSAPFHICNGVCQGDLVPHFVRCLYE